jgi:hypothetical protein
MKKQFEKEYGLVILEHLKNAPDSQLDISLSKQVKEFLLVEEHTDVEIWNFIKKILDLCVYGGASSSFVIKLLDLEPYFEAPKGGLKLEDNSISTAEWRKNI